MAVDGAREGEGKDGEDEDQAAGEGGDHRVVHDGVVEAHQAALSLLRGEEPEALDVLVAMVLVDRLPLLLEVGHVLLEPVIVYNLAARGYGSVEVGRLGELLPLGGAVADGRRQGHGRTLASVVELATRDTRLWSRAEVVVGMADTGGCSW